MGKKKVNYAEAKLQTKCVNHLKTVFPGVLYCGNHGGTCASSIMQAVRAKDTGYIAGSPDFPHMGLINGKTFNLRNPLRK